MGSDETFLFDRENPMSIAHPEYYQRYPTTKLPTTQEEKKELNALIERMNRAVDTLVPEKTPEQRIDDVLNIPKMPSTFNPPTIDESKFPIKKIEPDPINPEHYKKGKIECIEVTEQLGFLEGNALKYIWRHKYKNGEEDIRKAIWYCKRILKKDYGIEE